MQLDATGRSLSRRTLSAGLAVLLTCGALLAAGAASTERAEAAEVDFGIATGTIYFTKGETAAVAEGGGGASFICGMVPGPAKFACGAISASWTVQANRAKNRDMCLKVKFTQAPPPAFQHWPDIYAGDRCF